MGSSRTQLEGKRKKHSATDILDHPELRFTGVQSEYVRALSCQRHLIVHIRAPSDIYVTCQLVADNKPLTIPFRTSHKAFKTNFVSVVI